MKIDAVLSQTFSSKMPDVSYFKNVQSTKPKNYDLDEWLKMTIDPPAHLKKRVEQYRSTGDKTLKAALPCITVSATFKGYRNLESIDQLNHFICLDVDRNGSSPKAKINLVADMEMVKNVFEAHPSCYYTGYSTGGDGIYAIMAIAEPKKLDEYFNYFRKKLARIGINIDRQCKDWTRLRFFSYDKEAYLNTNAKKLRLRRKKKRKKPASKPSSHTDKFDNQRRVEKIVSECERHQLDITADYKDWVKIGAALNDEFGESGYEYFKRLSVLYAEHDVKEIKRKYRHTAKMKNVRLNSLFYVATSYGIRY